MEDHNRRQVKSLVALGVLAESPVIVGSLICIHTAEVTGSIPVSPTAVKPLPRKGFNKSHNPASVCPVVLGPSGGHSHNGPSPVFGASNVDGIGRSRLLTDV